MQSYLYGFAYGTSGYGVQELQGVNGYGIPCAVCEAKRRDVFLVPGQSHSMLLQCRYLTVFFCVSVGTTACPNSYEEEYDGYLVSVRNSGRYKGEYVCLDRNARQGSQGSSGSLWVPVEFKCGSLPCPPYTHDREVSICLL